MCDTLRCCVFCLAVLQIFMSLVVLRHGVFLLSCFGVLNRVYWMSFVWSFWQRNIRCPIPTRSCGDYFCHKHVFFSFFSQGVQCIARESHYDFKNTFHLKWRDFSTHYQGQQFTCKKKSAACQLWWLKWCTDSLGKVSPSLFVALSLLESCPLFLQSPLLAAHVP